MSALLDINIDELAFLWCLHSVYILTFYLQVWICLLKTAYTSSKHHCGNTHVSASLGKCLWGTRGGTGKGPWGAWEHCQPGEGVTCGWREGGRLAQFYAELCIRYHSSVWSHFRHPPKSPPTWLQLHPVSTPHTRQPPAYVTGWICTFWTFNPTTWGLLRWSLRIRLEAPRVVASTGTRSVSVTCLQMIGLWVIPTVSPSWITLLRTASCCLNSSLRVDTVSLLRGGYLGLAWAPLLTPCLPFWVAANLFSKVETVRNFTFPSLISTGRVWGFLFPHTLPNTCSCLWDFSRPGGHAVASPSGWGFVFLTTGGTEQCSEACPKHLFQLFTSLWALLSSY